MLECLWGCREIVLLSRRSDLQNVFVFDLFLGGRANMAVAVVMLSSCCVGPGSMCGCIKRVFLLGGRCTVLRMVMLVNWLCCADEVTFVTLHCSPVYSVVAMWMGGLGVK